MSSKSSNSISNISASSYNSAKSSPKSISFSSRKVNSIEEGIKSLDNENSEKSILTFDPQCVRQKANWSKANSKYRFDSGKFKPDDLLKDIPDYSPKLEALIKKIEDLDKKDQKKYGKKFKHFIFSDLKSASYGPKLISSAFLAKGWNLGYEATLLRKPTDKDEDQEDDEDDDEEDEGKMTGGKGSMWGPLTLKSDTELLKTKKENFFLLSSVSVFEKPISVKTKKDILAKYNLRPDNVYGDLARIIIMDSGFKEGIDLFDVKYVHIFEPSVNGADQKQVIGRGTRTCGQKGLDFHPTKGWPLKVFIYDLEIPERLGKGLMDAKTVFDLYIKALNLDVRLLNFAHELERTTVFGSVDYELNKNIHSFSTNDTEDSDDDEEEVYGGSSQVVKGGARVTVGKQSKDYVYIDGKKYKIAFSTMDPEYYTKGKKGKEKKEKREKKDSSNIEIVDGAIVERPSENNKIMNFVETRDFIDTKFSHCKWDKIVMENTCLSPEEQKERSENKGLESEDRRITGGASILDYTPSQNFVRSYFSPDLALKGMLLWHSVGTGKTCSAIAAASTNFETAGYTILWVTRTTLKNDIWKNMFSQVCNESIRQKIAAGQTIPTDSKKQMGLLSKSWRIRPMSYKQFSNLVSKQNDFYTRLVKENGAEDPLRKTLLIIDEAHKLYGGGDLSSIERPDMVAFNQALMHSYATSGKDSVRLLLMTATPITESPMELIKLVNLCKPVDQQMPNDFENFKSAYLNEDGEFTGTGREHFLDDIAGHVSYLNREKDARQFSQPVVQRVNVPIVKNMAKIDAFDKYLVKDELSVKTGELQTNLDTQNKAMEKELKQINKQRITSLIKEKVDCSTLGKDLKKSQCDKIIRKNITEIAGEVKDYIASIKDQAKQIKAELKGAKEYKKTELNRIISTIKASPEEYEKYKKSVYFALKRECGKTIKTVGQLNDQIDLNPEIMRMNEEIKKHEEHIAEMNTKLKVTIDGYQSKLKQMQNFLLDPDLSELERNVVRLTIADTRKNARKTKKNLTKETTQIINADKTVIHDLAILKRKQYRTLKKTIKANKVARKKELQKQLKSINLLRKTKRKQGKLSNEIKDMNIRELVEKAESNIKGDLIQKSEELAKATEHKIKMKENKQMEKIAIRMEKTAKKEEEKRERATRKIQEKLDKKVKSSQEKDVKETLKRQLKEAKIQERKAIAEHKKTQKKLDKIKS